MNSNPFAKMGVMLHCPACDKVHFVEVVSEKLVGERIRRHCFCRDSGHAFAVEKSHTVRPMLEDFELDA